MEQQNLMCIETNNLTYDGVRDSETVLQSSGSNGTSTKIESPAANGTSDMTARSVRVGLVPKWVNANLFLDVLKESVENFEKITNFKAQPALNPGENFLSLILHISLEVELKDKSEADVSLMIKIALNTGPVAGKTISLILFERELAMYFDVIPKLEQLYGEKGVDVCFGAKAYKFKKDPGQYNVLLEDLRIHGFKNANRLEGLNMEHTLEVLKKLALLHAASAHWVATSGPFPDLIMTNSFEKNSKIYENMLASFKDGFLSSMECFNGEKYRSSAESAFSNLELKSYLVLNEIDPNEFNVVNHGDCWSNNILFRYDSEGNILDTFFVDYQLSNWGSPSRDLYYFIISSVNCDIKLKHFDFFIRFYHDHLNKNLKILSYPKKIPTLRDLHIDMVKKGTWAFSTAIMLLPLILLDPTETADLENVTTSTKEGKHFKNSMYTNKRYCKYMAELLPWMYCRGIMEPFECLQNADYEKTPKEHARKAESKFKEIIAQPGELIPAWIKEDHFEDILKSTLKGFKAIQHFSVAPATTAGENYSSVLLKVNIESSLENGDDVSSSFMLKISHSIGYRKHITDLYGFFKKESYMYHEVIPQYEQIYKSAGIDVQFAPRYLKFSKDPGCETILLENLCTSGFKNANRLSGLDMAHTKSVLQKLAQLHAASAVYFDTIGSFPEMYLTGMHVEENRTTMEALIDQFYSVFVDCAKTYANSEEYLEKLRECKPKYFDTMMFLNKVQPDSFNVLNHGDCWTNNIMFQYNDDGSIKNTYFIDFQMPKYGSPAQDLYYFLLSSSKLYIKLEHFDYCIRYYHDNLMNNLKLLRYTKKIPTLRELHTELLNYGAWGLITIQGSMAAVLLEPSNDANLEFIVSENDESRNVKSNMFNAERYRSHAEPLLIWLNRRGLLDFECTIQKIS